MTMEKVTGIGGFFFRPREPIYPPIDPSRGPLGTTRKKNGENSSIRNIAAVNYLLSEGIIRPATTALARDRPAQANISIRNPKINA